MTNFIPKIRVSHSKSGFNAYLPNAAMDNLRGHRVALEIRKKQEGGYIATLIPHSGVNRFTEHSNLSLPYRISFRDVVGMKREEVPLFGTVDIEWMHATNIRAGNGNSVNGLSFHLPEVEGLPAPMNPKPRTPKGGGQVVLPLDKQPETPHAALGRVMREFNQLCANNDFSDVSLRVYHGNGDQTVTEFVEITKELRLIGKRTRVEELG